MLLLLWRETRVGLSDRLCTLSAHRRLRRKVHKLKVCLGGKESHSRRNSQNLLIRQVNFACVCVGGGYVLWRLSLNSQPASAPPLIGQLLRVTFYH